MSFWIVMGVIAVIVLFFVSLYNRIIRLVQMRKNAFSDIDVQLKLRHDLIPNLVETVKGYAGHEKDVFQKVTEARSRAIKGGSVNERVAAENALGSAMMNLLAVAENYPELKADAGFRQLQNELADVENKIAAARRFFNNATSEYNIAIHQFPAVIVARMFGFSEEIFFELTDAEKSAVIEPPKVNFS